jgi:hypothetical protein
MVMGEGRTRRTVEIGMALLEVVEGRRWEMERAVVEIGVIGLGRGEECAFFIEGVVVLGPSIGVELHEILRCLCESLLSERDVKGVCGGGIDRPFCMRVRRCD